MTDTTFAPAARVLSDFRGKIELLVKDYRMAGGYMPALASWLRLEADELADRFPDEVNGGRHD